MRATPLAIVSIVLLASWLGAALMIAVVVAPAAFAVLPTRSLSGALVGRVLPALFWSGVVVGLVVSMVTWSLPMRAWSTSAALVLVVACAAAQFVVAPRIARIRDAVGGPMDALARSDPRRLAFGQLHGVSVGMMGLGGLAAALALGILIRLTLIRTTP